jgi:thioester reductase-like protein
MHSILRRLEDRTAEAPNKLLYTFLDLNGRVSERYSYESFLHRVKIIAGHLRRERRLGTNDRVLLAYPPGLEMICAFFACAHAGLIPVPVYPPSSHEFRSALYKIAHIARDCQASAILTSRDYFSTLTANLARGRAPTSPLVTSDIFKLDWIVTEDFVAATGTDTSSTTAEILFLQYTSGSTSDPKGVMVTHANVLHNCDLVAEHAGPVAVTWLPQYHDMGLIGYYLYAALSGGTTYGFSPMDFIQRPALWFETITKYSASASSAPNFAFDYCLRPGRLSEQTLADADLSSVRFLMAAAEPVNAGTYSRFLQRFQPCGLNPTHFFVAYGLAESTLAVTNYGRTVLSVNKNALTLGRTRVVSDVSEIAAARQIVSCGRPLGDTCVKIVEPARHVALDDGHVGEIWVNGRSKCLGYWNKPELTRDTFHARIVGESQQGEGYLRTGDVGFFHHGELYVCGRIKDMIIVRGQNYYPHDVEHLVENASPLIRRGGVVAFEVQEDHGTALAIVAEVKHRGTVPDPRDLAVAIRNHLNVEAGVIALIAPRAIPKTSSGKLMRQRTKQMWLDGELTVLGSLARDPEAEHPPHRHRGLSTIDALTMRYKLTGTETCSLVDAGMDSLDLVLFMHELRELLKDNGASLLASEIDLQLVQHTTVAEVFRLAALFAQAPEAAMHCLRESLARVRENHRRHEREMMCRDTTLVFEPAAAIPSRCDTAGGVLLTGGTGFVGPFLLKSLLEQTDERIYVLVRAGNESHASERLWAALLSSLGPATRALAEDFHRRVTPVCGDLAQDNLGLTADAWRRLATRVHTVYHNAAAVNYLFNYETLRTANVLGTNEIIRLALDGRPKVFNYMSTTFIFGWAVKETLHETDSNAGMDLLDFGYSQSKWVSERLVISAARHGLATRIFRPALVTPSVAGEGNSFDIAIRLLAFMVNHGIAVDALNQVSFVPSDVAANNIVAISNVTETINGTYHVTRDEYANMMDIVGIITMMTGRQFELFKLPEFVPEVIKRCTKDDLLFPLLDFLIGSIDSISSMEFKRYDSSSYQAARNRSPWGRPDPSLKDTVAGILRFMQGTGIISVPRLRLPPIDSDAVRSSVATKS